MGWELAAWAPQMSARQQQEDLRICNEATEAYGLSLSDEQMRGLTTRRREALAATGRVEFGRGVLRELVAGFASSPYLVHETYEETIADLQDLFYRCKEEAEATGGMADEDLIAAMRVAFDEEAHGATDVLEGMGLEGLRKRAEQGRAGEYHEKTLHEEFEEEEAHDGRPEHLRDEFSRVLEDERWERPGNEYADGFYDGYNELYRVGFDSNSRIGGSALG